MVKAFMIGSSEIGSSKIKRRLLVLAVAACGSFVPLIGGCSSGPDKNEARVQQNNHGDENKLAPRDAFEQGKEVPISADTHCAAGQVLESQGNMVAAVDRYREALRINSKHRNALFRMGIVYVKQNRFPEAIETWNKYIEATGGEATAYGNLGFAYELAGRNSDAEQAYLKGIRREPTNSVCRVNYGLMLARRERFNEAILQLQTVLTEAEVRYNMASVYESLGRKEQARLEYRKALQIDPAMKDAQARLDAME